MKREKKEVIMKIAAVAAMLALIAVMVIDLLPLLKDVVSNAGDEAQIAQYIDSYGLKGVPILMGLQALQIIIAVIPSAVIQVLTGLCYGAWWGTLINIAGSVFGNMLVFVAVRQLKSLLAPVTDRVSRRGDVQGIAKLSQIKKPELLAFSFFLIPGIPNGIMPYLFARTGITLPQYILSIVAGSIPSTFICTFMGDRISKGSYTAAIIIALFVAVVIIVFLINKNKIIAKVTDAYGDKDPKGKEKTDGK